MLDDHVVHCRLPRSPAASNQARELVAENLESECIERRIEIALAVGEMVTNAVRHGDEPIHLAIAQRDDGLRVEIGDGSPDQPVFRVPSDDGGFGLHLIAAIADRWGAEPVLGGKRVWAEFDTGK